VCQRSTLQEDRESALALQQGASTIAATTLAASKQAWLWETPYCPAQASLQRNAFQQQKEKLSHVTLL